MTYTSPAVLTTSIATSTIQMQSGDKLGGQVDAGINFTNNPAYEGDE